MNTKKLKKQLILNIPYIILGLAATNLGEAWRLTAGVNASQKVQSLVLDGVNMIFGDDAADAGRGVHVRVASDHGAGVENAVAADFHAA